MKRIVKVVITPELEEAFKEEGFSKEEVLKEIKKGVESVAYSDDEIEVVEEDVSRNLHS